MILVELLLFSTHARVCSRAVLEASVRVPEKTFASAQSPSSKLLGRTA